MSFNCFLDCLPIQCLWGMLFLPPLLCRRFKEWLFGVKQPQPHQNQISDVFLRLVFTTSGLPLTPLPLTPVGKIYHGKRQLTLTKRISQYNGLFSVYRGDLDGEKVVTKITEDDTLWEVLKHEALIYQHLSDLQGFVIPTFLGLFNTGGCYLLITADCGVSLRSFSTLSKAQRYVFFFFSVSFLID